MEIQEILLKLEYNWGSLPYDAVQEAVRRKEEIIPELLEILDYTTQNRDQIEEDPTYFAHIYSMFLLAQFREKRAYPLVVDLFTYPEYLYLGVEDFITEYLPRILASVCCGDTTLIKQLIENEDVNEYIRDAGLRALVILVVNGEKPRNEIMDYFKSLFRGKLERKYSYVWDSLVSCSCDLYPEEVYEDIKKVISEDLTNPIFINFEDVKVSLSMGMEENLASTKADVHNQFIDDAVKCLEVSHYFEIGESVTSPKRFEGKKIGRNQPCPCGSGKKYKKCCGSMKKHLRGF